MVEMVEVLVIELSTSYSLKWMELELKRIFLSLVLPIGPKLWIRLCLDLDVSINLSTSHYRTFLPDSAFLRLILEKLPLPKMWILIFFLILLKVFQEPISLRSVKKLLNQQFEMQSKPKLG